MGDINKIVKPREGFQYSVNIAYDIYDDNKIGGYIPSNSSLQIIEELLASAESRSTERAHILTGAYGKGKSHLILYVLALLAGGRDRSLFEVAINKAAEVNPTLAKNIEEYISSGKKLLPVIVNATSFDIKATMLQSLSAALECAGLKSIMPSTFFDSAIEKLLDWMENYKKTYGAFEQKVGMSGEKFIDKLKDYNQSTYDLFVKIYPTLTAGSEFNPLAGSDVIKVYDSVCQEIARYGYNGIFVVYDEFGKFLEGSVERSSALDIKILQDFAERCNRSGSSQLHLMLISHKRIDNYIGGLPKIKVDAWKAVSNRFKVLTIENSESEIYDMVSTVLYKDRDAFMKFAAAHKDQFDRLQDVIERDYAFSMIGDRDALALKCYPLQPYALLILPKISELIAQNERTIFTFLSSSERYSVNYFLRIDKEEFPLIEPDYIYDYFEPLFKGEPYGSAIKKQWQITTSALSKLKDSDNELAEKIVKTLALIYCIDDFEIIPPSWNIISEIYSVHYGYGAIDAALQALKNSHVLIELMYKPYVRITEGSNINVLELIQQEQFKLEAHINSRDLLNGLLQNKYLYPVQYNDENEITRYFEFRFINVSDIENVKEDFNADQDADGIVYGVLVENEQDLQSARALVAKADSRQAVFIVPNESYDSRPVAAEYSAVMNLISQYNNKDSDVLEELHYIREDRLDVLNSFMENTYFRLDKKKASVYYRTVQYPMSRKSKLPQLLSQIMEQIYKYTPKIVNELINCNEVSSPVRNARDKIIKALLSSEIKEDLGLTGGPELNIMRSLLVTPGILVNGENPYIEYDCKDEKLRTVLREIRIFILQSAGTKGSSLGNLYKILRDPYYGYGLKKGIIPVLLAVALIQYKDHVTILRKGKEYAVSSALLSAIESAPDDYSLILEEWNNTKEIYVVQLESIFDSWVNYNDKGDGRFSYIVKAMRRWYLQLPKFSLATKQYCAEDGFVSPMDTVAIRFRNSLSNSELNPHEFLFVQIPKIYSTSMPEEAAPGVRKSFEKINSTYSNWRAKIIRETKAMFGVKDKESLASGLANFYDDLNPVTKEHSFSGKIALFINIAKNPCNDEDTLVEKIARALFNLRMSDFTDVIMNGYIESLASVKAEILRYDEGVAASRQVGGSYKIVYTDDAGNDVVKQFDSTEETTEGQLLFNDLTYAIEEYGESISDDEKRQVLFKILKDLM